MTGSSASGGDRLEIRGLTVSRGDSVLIHAMSFALGRGELLAVRGANGCGKTTLLRCVAGLSRSDAGDVRWDGVAAHSAASAFAASVLYAGHLPGIKDDLTAEENLATALALRGRRVPGDELRGALADVGLERHLGLPARRLSAGQRRRIGLARLALDPADLWILDEPLTALDAAGATLLGERLATHLDRGALALVATHHDLPLGSRAMRELRLP